MEIIHNIALDVSRHGVQASIPITRGENGVHKLVITLRNKGVPIELSNSDSAVLYLDTDAFEPVTVYTANGAYPNSLVYTVTAYASATTGAKKATIQISQTSLNRMFTADIMFNVCDNGTYNSKVLNSPPYSAVLKAKDQAEEYCKQAEEKIESVEPRLEQMEADYNKKISQTNEDLEEGLNQKLDKKSYADYMRVYGTHPDGRQGMFLVSPAVLSSGAAIIMRDINGNADIGDPTKPAHIANKKYVDSTVASAENNFTERADTLEGNLTTAKSELEASISEVESIAKGATQAESFFDYEEMVEKLNVAPRDTYRIGQSLFINTHNVPDLWIYNKGISSTAYNYTTDEVFVNELKSKGHVKVGYFTLAPLETQKVDLTEYVKNTDYATGSKAGLVKTENEHGYTRGIVADRYGALSIDWATHLDIDERVYFKPIVPATLEYAVKSVTYDRDEIDNKVTEKLSSFSDGDTVTVQNNTFYRADSEISSLNIVYPNGNFSCAFSFKLADSGDITITLPESKYIGGIPSFNNGETWELNIKNGVVVGGLVE